MAETERCGCEERHDHGGPWVMIGVAIALLFAGWYLALMLSQHQFDVIYDRVGGIQRQLECLPTEKLVTDHEGNEYCLEMPEH